MRWLGIFLALLLTACVTSEKALWPSLTGKDPDEAATSSSQRVLQPAAPDKTGRGKTVRVPPEAKTGEPEGWPPLGQTDFSPSGVTPGIATGTFVGKRVVELRDKLSRLQNAIGGSNESLQRSRGKILKAVQRYKNTVGAINARLQVGTTPGNPILVQQFVSCRADLERLAAEISELNQLATEIGPNTNEAMQIMQSVRAAFNISGAVDEDHRQLAVLESEVNRTAILLDGQSKEVAGDVRRQTNYVASERSNLNLLSAGIKSGEIYGASLVNRAMASEAGDTSIAASTEAKSADISDRRPLIVIRFDEPNVPYQQDLYNAFSRALVRRPDATFDLVAVAPVADGPAASTVNRKQSRHHGEEVLRALIEMGLPPGRIAIAGTTSDTASVSEVHVYLKGAQDRPLTGTAQTAEIIPPISVPKVGTAPSPMKKPASSFAPPSTPPLTEPKTVNPDIAMAVQKRLIQLGFDAGSVDGVVGNKTRVAIKAFERLEGLSVTGDVSESLLDRLNTVAASEKTELKGDRPNSPRSYGGAESEANFGRYHAVVIGNNDYRAFPRLKTAVNDARAVARLLGDLYGFEITLLENASRAGIVTALNKKRSELGRDDNLLIYYAGHGVLDEGAERGYWLPVDADRENPTNWVSNATVTDAIRAISAKHVMIVADSCFSGTLQRGVAVSLRSSDYWQRVVGKKARTVLTSGGLEPVTDSGGGEHSAFAKAFLQALRQNSDVLDGHRLFTLIQRPVMVNSDQTPEYGDLRRTGHDGGDFLFVRRK